MSSMLRLMCRVVALVNEIIITDKMRLRGGDAEGVSVMIWTF